MRFISWTTILTAGRITGDLANGESGKRWIWTLIIANLC